MEHLATAATGVGWEAPKAAEPPQQRQLDWTGNLPIASPVTKLNDHDG